MEQRKKRTTKTTRGNQMKMTVEQREREVRRKKKKRKLMRKLKRKRKRKTSRLFKRLDQNVFWLNLLDHNVGSSYTNLQYLT